MEIRINGKTVKTARLFVKTCLYLVSLACLVALFGAVGACETGALSDTAALLRGILAGSVGMLSALAAGKIEIC